MSDPDVLMTADIPDAVEVERTPVLAIIASLLLHVLLGLVFLQLSPGNQMQPEAPQRTVITITLQEQEPPAPAEEPLSPETVAEVALVADEEAIPSGTPADEITPPAETPAPPQMPEQEVATAETEAGQQVTPGLSYNDVTAAVSSYMSTYRSNLNQDWVAVCQRYKVEHGVQDCPQGQPDGAWSRSGNELIVESFERINGKYQNQQTSRELLANMDRMRPLLNDDSIVGELARQRYSYDSFAYTRINGDDRVPRGGAGAMTFLQFSPTGLVLFNGLMTFDFLTGELGILDEQDINQPQKVVELYNFRGPGAAVPSSEDEDSFRMVPSIFPTARQ